MYVRHLKGGCKHDGARLLSAATSARTRGSGHKLEHKRFLVTSRSISVLLGARALTQVAQRGPRVSSLEIFRSLLDTVLGTQLWVSLPEQHLGQTDPEVLANLSL